MIKRNVPPVPPVDQDLQKKGTDSKIINNEHIGTSNAFEETENPLSAEADNITDERLDEMVEE